MKTIQLLILPVLCVLAVYCEAQQVESAGYPGGKAEDTIVIQAIGGTCKSKKTIYKSTHTALLPVSGASPKQPKEDFLNIRGNIVYNFNYRSLIDTPFQQKGLAQHTVQTFMDGDIAGRYPFRAVFTYRTSNSPYFSNSSGISIQYRQADMLEKIRADLRRDAGGSLDKNLLRSPSERYRQPASYQDSLIPLSNPLTRRWQQQLDSLYQLYAQKRQQWENLQQQYGHQNLAQALVEAREAKLFGRSGSSSQKDSAALWNQLSSKGLARSEYYSPEDKPSTNTDTLSGEAKLVKMQDSLVTLQQETRQAEKNMLLFQKKLADTVQQLKRRINQLHQPQEVKDYITTQDTAENNRLSKGQKLLLSVNQIGIGRSWINYSELTVSNVSLNGFNIEASPGKYYIAAAIGSVNSQFRDFILNNNTGNQSVRLLRFGLVSKKKDDLLLTVYQGKKALLNTSGIGDSSTTEPIMGASLAGTRQLNHNTSLTLEYARSSYQDVYDPAAPDKSSSLFARVLNFGMHSNDAWSIGFKSVYPKTNTKIDGTYRKMGEAFQSFTLYSTGVKQDAYNFHISQLLWKKQLTIDASVKKNEFNSPLTAPGYSNTAVFKSIQATLAVPGYPFISVGYYPSSQLFVGTEGIAYQSFYNTLNAISSYSYKAAQLNMMTNLMYTKFYNHQSDSSFVYYNASTFSATQTVYASPFTLMATCTVSDQDSLDLTTVEPVVSWQYKNILTLTGGIAYSRLNGTQTLWGSTAGLSVLLKHIGTIQLHYDKVYLPAYKGGLLPVDMGRITYNRPF